MQPRLLGRIGLIAALAATGVTCKGNPTAEGTGEPFAVHAEMASLNVVVGRTASFSAWVLDVRSNRLEVPLEFSPCNATLATVVLDATFDPVPATSAKGVVTGVNSGPTCAVVASSGLKPDTVVVVVAKAAPVVSPKANLDSAAVGATLTDTARVLGGFGTVAGTITFRLYSPSQATCAASPRLTQTLPVSGPGPYSTSPGFVTDSSGTWRWTVAYSGDTNNVAVVTACGSQLVRITP